MRIQTQSKLTHTFTRLGLISALLMAALGVTPVRAAAPAPLLAGDSGDANLHTPTSQPAASEKDLEKQAQDAYNHLSLYFIENQGQTDECVAYYVQQGGVSIYFTAEEMVMALPETVLRLRFVDADPATQIVGRKEEKARVNYFIGNDPEKWHTSIPTYGEIAYRDLYPGIDLTYTGWTGALKYNFVLRPGADVADIRLAYRGAEELRVEENGDLVIATGVGELRDAAPYVYQEIGGARVEVEAAFVLYDAHTYGFAMGDYDSRYPLVVDPSLLYSTFLGGA